VSRRILLLITDLQIGGTPTVVRELALRLAKDANVHVACLDRWGPVADQLRDRGIAVTALNAGCRWDVGVIRRLIRLIRTEQIDTVFSFLIHANAVAAAASWFTDGVRFFQSIQTTQPDPAWHWTLQRLIKNHAEKIVVPSPSAAEAARNWAGIAAEKIVVIPNAVDIDEFPRQLYSRVGKRVGFIGRLDPIKRIDDLVVAMSLLGSQFTLDIFGEGPQRTEIETIIARLGVGGRVKLRGVVNGAKEALAGMDVLVLPSDAEGFGLVLIEAMAAGVPVIGTNVSGIRDVIEDGVSGILVPARAPASLAKSIENVLSDDVLWAKLANGGMQRVRQRFDWAIVFEQYRALLLN